MSNNHHQHSGGCCGGHAPTVAAHEFWTTQPVGVVDPSDAAAATAGAIEKTKLDAVRKEPYALPAGFEWANLDLKDEAEMKKLYTLLTENYVEDQDAMFRFDYSPAFLQWALCLDLPSRQPDWLVGVKVQSTGRLVGFISAVPARMRLEEKTVAVAEVNFLCVHKKLRSKRLAPVLIKEVTRRVNLTSVWQAVYTAGLELPVPVASPRYYHRLLNVRKLVDVGFAAIPANSTSARHARLLKLPDLPVAQPGGLPGGLRPMDKRHVKQVASLLRENLKKFKLAPELSNEEVSHWLLPRENVLYSFVKEDPVTGKVTDFFSFYHLPSQCLHHKTPADQGEGEFVRIKAGYMFYSVATSMPMKQLMELALWVAQSQDFDVFNCLDIMDNEVFLDDLKFGRGDGILNYYVYNYRISKLPPNQLGLILL